MKSPSPLYKKVYTDLNECYIRVGEVTKVSLVDNSISVRLLDRPINENDNLYITPEVQGLAIIGSDDPKTTYAVSSAMYGIGDRVAVLVAPGVNYVVSILDVPEFINTGRLALIHEFALLDVLNQLCVSISYTYNAYSYVDFLNTRLNQVTRIDGIPNEDTNRFFNRLLKSCLQGAGNEISKVQCQFWQATIGGGPSPVPVQKINNTRRYGKTINHLPYLVFEPFSATDYLGDYSVYSSTEQSLHLAKEHPLDPNPIFKNYFNQTIIWFNDNDPDYVLAIVCHPTWDSSKNLSQYIQFIEIPVYSFSERKRNDGTNESTDEPPMVCWQRYEDQVRVVHTIQRDWIDWTIFDNDANYTVMLATCPTVMASRVNSLNFCTFGLNDGFGRVSGNTVLQTSKVKRLIGDIQRVDVASNAKTYFNGSRYDYLINHDNPADGYTTKTLSYTADVNYYSNGAGTFSEYQVATTNTRNASFNICDDGTNQLTKKIDFDYSATGRYGDGTGGSGRTSWSSYVSVSGSGMYVGLTSFSNSAWEEVYLNSTLIFTNFSEAILSSMQMSFESNLNFILHMDMENELFVIEEVRQVIDPCLGPGATTTGSLVHSVVVIDHGTRYVIWTYTKTITTCPNLNNFFPWLLDPDWVTYDDLGYSTAYNYTATITSDWWWFPFVSYYVPPVSGITLAAAGYPSPAGTDIASTLFVAPLTTPKLDKSAYLLIDQDPETDSWVVKSDCWLPSGSGVTISYTNASHAVFKINGSIDFIGPTDVYKIITVDPSLM